MTERPSDPAWTTGEHGEVEEPPHPLRALDLRVARIVEAKAHPNADRLLVLQIDAGEPSSRQLVAGIAGKYAPDELPGKSIVIVANLQPAKLRGEISQGMLLAAEDERGLGLLLAPDAPPGASVVTVATAQPADQITIDDFRRHELIADDGGVTIDGASVTAPKLVMDRGVRGRLK